MSNFHQILIVDDDACIVRMLSSYASNHGWEPVLARDGPEAILKAALFTPDVVLLDVSMPKLDGRDVCIELKRNRATSAIPVIVLSARGSDPYLRQQAFEMGAFDVFAKPVCLPALFKRVEQAVRMSSPPVAGEELSVPS